MQAVAHGFGVPASADNQYLRTSRPSVLHISKEEDARQDGANRWFAEQQALQADCEALLAEARRALRGKEEQLRAAGGQLRQLEQQARRPRWGE